MHELLSNISGNELAEWMAFERIEPFGSLVEDFRAGQVAATVANVQRQAKTEPFKASDFMPALRAAIEPLKPPPQVLTDEEHTALMDAELFGMTRH